MVKVGVKVKIGTVNFMERMKDGNNLIMKVMETATNILEKVLNKGIEKEKGNPAMD